MDLSHLRGAPNAVDLSPKAAICRQGDWLDLHMKSGRRLIGRAGGAVYGQLGPDLLVPILLELETLSGVVTVMWDGVETMQRVDETEAKAALETWMLREKAGSEGVSGPLP